MYNIIGRNLKGKTVAGCYIDKQSEFKYNFQKPFLISHSGDVFPCNKHFRWLFNTFRQNNFQINSEGSDVSDPVGHFERSFSFELNDGVVNDVKYSIGCSIDGDDNDGGSDSIDSFVQTNAG